MAFWWGSGTALTDDPLLTVRGTIVPCQPPRRIILDSQLRLPLNSQLVRTVGPSTCRLL